jgi:hypothetical protein
MLHITNGDSTVYSLAESGLSGEFHAWRDVLHEGPTPGGLTLAEMSRVRSRFLADQGWGDPGEIAAEFSRRDETLAAFRDHDEVVLWFEHDLYDQLQLIQILDWFSRQDRGATALSLICIDRHPGIEPFHGLGQLAASDFPPLFKTRHPVSDAELSLGRAAWEAFCSPDPTSLDALARGETGALPFLGEALTRHLEEFPSVRRGVARSERHILRLVAAGTHHPLALFMEQALLERRTYVGDTVFWAYIQRLTRGSEPLLALSGGAAFSLPESSLAEDRRFMDQSLVLTDCGRAVLEGRADAVERNGIDRWLGGVHLRGRRAAWRWDEARCRIVPGSGEDPGPNPAE